MKECAAVLIGYASFGAVSSPRLSMRQTISVQVWTQMLQSIRKATNSIPNTLVQDRYDVLKKRIRHDLELGLETR